DHCGSLIRHAKSRAHGETLDVAACDRGKGRVACEFVSERCVLLVGVAAHPVWIVLLGRILSPSDQLGNLVALHRRGPSYSTVGEPTGAYDMASSRSPADGSYSISS